MKIISTLNILLAALFVGNLLYLDRANQGAPLLLFVNLLCASSLILIAFIVLLRLVRLIGFARVLAYAVILVLGLQFLLTLKYLMSGGALTLVIDFVVVFYAIGMRGYLASPKLADYFLGKSN